MTNFAAPLLGYLRLRITRIFPDQVRTCLETLGDDEIWWRPNESSNSVGNLVVHICGSLNHYLNRNIGGTGYERHRDAEFAERRHLPRAELLALLDGMVADAERTFDQLTPERLDDPSAEPERYSSLAEDLIGMVSHFSTHAGQIVWITKMLHDNALDEVWMRSHKRLGGWTPQR
jgi:uncharacterized damage-inducible protein DinB